jgi:predicted RNA-binding Zn-ribbon protein involved in translation (DUF1610 family)
MVKCNKCDWEGAEAELVEKPGNLMFYDRVAIDSGVPDVTRIDYRCPRCGELLKTHRVIGGVVFD